MKFLPICFLLAAFAAVINSQDVLQCYVCEDCNDLTDNDLQTCGPETTTPTTAATTVSGETTTSSSSESSSTASSTGESSSSVSTESSSTASSTGESSSSVATESSSTASSTGESSSSLATESSSTITTISDSTSTPATTTTTPAPPASDTGNENAAEIGGETGAGTGGENVAGTGGETAVKTLNNVGSTSELLLRNYRSISRVVRATNSTTYACYTIDVQDGDSVKVKRGCIVTTSEDALCTILGNENDLASTNQNCYVCQTDRCNSSAALQISLISLLIVAFVKILA